MIIAIDGTAASGKGTLAKRLAAKLGYAYLDTGALYRATASKVRREGNNPEDETAATDAAKGLTEADLAADDLRSGETGSAASIVAAHPGVRAALLEWQRDFAANPPGGEAGAVLDGRDIGTVVCPDADKKLYVDARVDVRAHRRFLELRVSNPDLSEAAVEADLIARDARDKGRASAPLAAADDAITLDTSDMNVEQAWQAALSALKIDD